MMAGRPLGWWRTAELIAGSLTRPQIDCARADGAVRNVIVRSRLFAWGAVGIAAIRRTWADSTAAKWIWQLEHLPPAASADRIRFYARCVCLAAISVLILLPFGTSSGRGFQTIVPIVVASAALAVDRAAALLARASLDRRA